MTGSGKIIFSRRIGFFSSQSVSPVRVSLETDGRVDVARVGLGELFALVRVHAEDAADALPLVARRVRAPSCPTRDLAGVDAEERQVPVLIVHAS